MPQRDVVLATNEIYHIYNRSNGKESIFHTQNTLRKVLEIIHYYRFPQRIRLSQFDKLSKDAKESYLLRMKNATPLIEIYTFAFMPNHYHFLLKQLEEDGIVKFISTIQNSYAKYFNTRYDRSGNLFQNSFKGKWIDTDEVFMHVSRYQHLNPVTKFMLPFEKLAAYPWTSFQQYCTPNANSFVNTQFLLDMFPSREAYIHFVSDQVDYQRTLDKLRDYILE